MIVVSYPSTISIVSHYTVGLFPVYAFHILQASFCNNMIHVIASLLGHPVTSTYKTVIYHTVLLIPLYQGLQVATHHRLIYQCHQRISTAECIPIGIIIVPIRFSFLPISTVKSTVTGQSVKSEHSRIKHYILFPSSSFNLNSSELFFPYLFALLFHVLKTPLWHFLFQQSLCPIITGK